MEIASIDHTWRLDENHVMTVDHPAAVGGIPVLLCEDDGAYFRPGDIMHVVGPEDEGGSFDIPAVMAFECLSAEWDADTLASWKRYVADLFQADFSKLDHGDKVVAQGVVWPWGEVEWGW